MFTPATAASTRSSASSASRREVRLCAAIAASTSAAAINVSLIASRPAVLPRTAINVAAIRSGNACQSRYAGVRRPDWVSLLLNVSFSSKQLRGVNLRCGIAGQPARVRAQRAVHLGQCFALEPPTAWRPHRDQGGLCQTGDDGEEGRHHCRQGRLRMLDDQQNARRSRNEPGGCADSPLHAREGSTTAPPRPRTQRCTQRSVRRPTRPHPVPPKRRGRSVFEQAGCPAVRWRRRSPRRRPLRSPHRPDPNKAQSPPVPARQASCGRPRRYPACSALGHRLPVCHRSPAYCHSNKVTERWSTRVEFAPDYAVDRARTSFIRAEIELVQ